MSIQKVWIEEGCTVCGLCAEICPEVFTIEAEAIVKPGVNFTKFELCIMEAAENCPVEIIKFE